MGLAHLTRSSFRTETIGEVRTLVAEISLPFAATEFVPSWNVEPRGEGWIEVRLKPNSTHTYKLGSWSLKGENRTSVNEQNDEVGRVLTDILRLKQPVKKMRVEIALHKDAEGREPALKRFFLSYLAPGTQPALAKGAEVKELLVPTMSQGDYENGGVLCSPTCLGMMLGYWAAQKGEPGWNRAVPEIKEAIYDPGWQGTGNWPFNMALPGSMDGLTAYVSRLRGMHDLENLVRHGVPVTVSVSYPLVKGQPRTKSDDGHLMVVVGFTAEGDVVVNDPGKSLPEVRQIYPRQRLMDGWAASQLTVYMIHPDGWPLPAGAGPWVSGVRQI